MPSEPSAKGRLDVSTDHLPTLRDDALSALINLGYAQREATRAIDWVMKEKEYEDLGEILRVVLQRL